MNKTEQVEIYLEVGIEDATEEETDVATRQLLSELRELNIESAELVKAGQAPQGSKGDAITIGSIAIEVLPALLPSVIGLVQVWVTRGQGRKVKFKGRMNRKLIEFEGTPQQFQKLLATLEKGNKGL